MQYLYFILISIFFVPIITSSCLLISWFLQTFYLPLIIIIFTYFYIKYKFFRKTVFYLYFFYMLYSFYNFKIETETKKQIHYVYVSHPCGRVKQISENKFKIWYDSDCMQQSYLQYQYGH